MAPTFTIQSCVSLGWRTFWKRPWLFVQAALILLAVSIGFNIVFSVLQTMYDGLGALAILVGIAGFALSIFSIYVSIVLDHMGYTSLMLKAHDNVGTANIRALWTPHPFWKFTGTLILGGLLIFVGFLLLIIPGITLGLGWAFSSYLVLERNLGPIEALSESWRITRGNRFRLFLLSLLLLLINLIGLLALVIGLLVTIPVSILAYVHAYRTPTNAPSPTTA